MAPNEVAEDTRGDSFAKTVPDQRMEDCKTGVLGEFIFPEEHHLKDDEPKKVDDNEIKPGQSIEV